MSVQTAYEAIAVNLCIYPYDLRSLLYSWIFGVGDSLSAVDQTKKQGSWPPAVRDKRQQQGYHKQTLSSPLRTLRRSAKRGIASPSYRCFYFCALEDPRELSSPAFFGTSFWPPYFSTS